MEEIGRLQLLIVHWYYRGSDEEVTDPKRDNIW